LSILPAPQQHFPIWIKLDRTSFYLLTVRRAMILLEVNTSS
jgi:hypothetical protein